MAPRWRLACRPVFPFLEGARRFAAACDEAQIRDFLGGSNVSRWGTLAA